MNNKYLNLAIVLLGLMAAPLTQATELSAEDYDLYPGDFNGDGKTDLLYVAKDPAKLSGIATSDGNGPNTVWQTWVSNYLNIDWSRNQYIPLVADFNGDGKADIFLQKATIGDHYLLLSDSRGYVVGISQALSNTAFGSNLALSADQHKLIAGDFNGIEDDHRRADLFLQATTTSGTHGIAYADGNGQFMQGVAKSWTNTSNSPGGFKWSTQDANIFAGDFNGDGMADLLLQAKPRWVMIDYDVTFPVPTYPNAMNGIAYGNAITTSFGASYRPWNRNEYGIDWSPLTHNLVVGNFNGDNFADVLFQPKNSTDTAYLLLRDGNNPAEFSSAPSTLTSSGIGGASSRLLGGKFTSSGSTGLYYQALTAGGNNYVAGSAGASASVHTYSSLATNFLVPALPPGQTTVAGRTVGKFSVSESSGAARYEIPIWMPPAAKNFQPKLSIVYDGNIELLDTSADEGPIQDVGPLGKHFSIGGLSAVEPCSTTFAQDGGVYYPYPGQPSTPLCLNGNRLRIVSGEYGKDGSVYRTELDDGSIVTAHGYQEQQVRKSTLYPSTIYVPVGAPLSFTVQSKDGLTYEYGATSDSRVYRSNESFAFSRYWYLTKWLLTKVSDANGNSYVITYDTNNRSATETPFPLAINYAPNVAGGSNYQYSVNFSYQSGMPISVSRGGQVLRKYNFSFQPYPDDGGYRLTQIQECTDDMNANCFAPTVFTWSMTPDQYGIYRGAASVGAISSITDGYGSVINLDYENLDVGGWHGDIYLYLGARLVKQVTSSDGIGGVYTESYTYGGSKYDSDREKFNVDSVIYSDSRDGFIRKTTYANGQAPQLSFPYTGMVSQSDVFQSDGITPVSSIANTLDALTLDSTSNNQRYNPYVSQSIKDTYEVGGPRNAQWITREITNRNPPDTYSNPGTISVAATDKDTLSPYYGQTWTTVTNTTFGTDANAVASWCTSLPLSVTVTKLAPTVSSIARTVAYANDYQKCRAIQTVIEPTIPAYTVTQNYAFDGFGNASIVTTTAAGVAGSRVASTNWGSTGQFPISVTNAANETTTYGYDYDHGVRTRVTDPNERSTYTNYDGFQRKISELNPNGTGTAWTYTDCRASATCINGNQRLQVYERSMGVGAVAIRDSYQFLDQFDRQLVSRSKQMDGSYRQIEMRYNAQGKLFQESVPCVASSCAAYWTTNSYDLLGRLTSSSRPISVTNSNSQATIVTYEGRKTTTTDPQGKQKIEYSTVAGTMGRAQDHNGYYQDFTYDAFGGLVKVKDSQAVTWFTATYDYGIGAFQRTIADADLGARAYDYNALGEVTHSSDAKGQHLYFEYDALSRLTKRTEPDALTTFGYGNNPAAHNVGSLQFEQTVADGMTYREDYTYDLIGRLANKSMTLPGSGTSGYDYTYNATNGEVDTLTYPVSTAGFRLKLQYAYQNAVLSQVTDYNAGTLFWRANAMNARGQLTNETLGNGINAEKVFDPVTGWIKTVKSGPTGSPTSVQNASYLQDLVGHLTQRQNNNLGLTESFYYDNLYRLDYSQLNGSTNLQMCYDNPTANTCAKNLPGSGNISSRSDIGTGTYGTQWTYDAIKKHAVLTAGSNSYAYDANGNASTRNGNAITWTSYNYPKQINNTAGETINFQYGPDRQRWRSVYTSAAGQPTETTFKIGEKLEQVVVGSSMEYRHYISGASGRIAIYSRKSDGSNALRYMLEDHEGSTDKILSDTGAVQYSESYTAFGSRRNATTWSGSVPTTELNATYAITRQGYNGQDMLGNMGLVHMNGRVQDSIIGRFLSADPYITEPDDTQNYNRYSYVGNDPLDRVDPSGFWWDVPQPVVDFAAGFGDVSIDVTLGLVTAGGFNGPDARAALGINGGITESGAYKNGVGAGILSTVGLGALARSGASTKAAANANKPKTNTPKTVVIDRSKYPESAAHVDAAQAAGQPSVLTVDRSGAAARRSEAMRGTQPTPGKDRDEYPPAMFKEGGGGASVRAIDPSDNRGAGASMGRQCSSVKDGEEVKVVCR